jgi:hypothetical protein
MVLWFHAWIILEINLLPFIPLVANSNNTNTTEVLAKILYSSSYVFPSHMQEYSMFYIMVKSLFRYDVIVLILPIINTCPSTVKATATP